MRLILLILMATLWRASVAEPVWPTWPEVRQDTEQFAYDRIGDGRRMLLGAYPPRVRTPPPGQSCAELYQQRVKLIQQEYDYRPGFTDDPRNRAAVFIGSIFTPGFYFLAFSGIQNYNDVTNNAETQARLDALRYASAEQQCFVQ